MVSHSSTVSFGFRRGASGIFFLSTSVSVSVSVSGGVTWAFLKRFTRSVELSDLYCLFFQLWGAQWVALTLSKRPAAASLDTASEAPSGVVRRA